MSPLLHIRKHVLKLSQVEMAAVAGVSQATVSRWEKGELEPDRNEMISIRDHAVQAGCNWNDSWFFSSPTGINSFRPEALPA